MSGKNFQEIIQLIRKDDPRYETGAYTFMRQALDFTLSQIQKDEKTNKHRHVSGQELCQGIRDFALDQFARRGQFGEQLGKIAGGLGKFALLFNNETG